MKKFIYFNIIIFVAISLQAQKHTISGFVSDSITGEKLIYATIYEKYSQNFTTTNNFGFYSFSVAQQDSIEIIVSFIGYDSYSIKQKIYENSEINVKLPPFSNQIKKIIVRASTNTNLSSIRLTAGQLSKIPTLGSEQDLLKAFQLMPGVMQGIEGKSNMYVRGGSSDQNLILLDDIPLYSIEHLGGFFSVFNNDAINSVRLYKGDFPANYGGRLSSIMDIRMKDGNMKKFGGTFSVGVLSTKMFFEGPIIIDKASFILSFRRSFLDVFLTPYFLIFEGDYFNYHFYDFNSKINYKISDNNIVNLSIYSGTDKSKNGYLSGTLKNFDSNFDKMKGGNILTSLKWRHVYNQKLFSNITASYTRFNYSFNNFAKEYYNSTLIRKNITDLSSRISDFSLKTNFEFSVFNSWKINFGANYTKHIFKPTNVYYYLEEESIINYDTTFYTQQLNADEISFYAENKIKILNFLNINIGFRENIYKIDSSTFFSHEPRVNLVFFPFKKLSFKTSYTKSSQNIHMLIIDDNAFFKNLWIPTTSYLPPEKAEQYSFSATAKFNNNYKIETEIYYKKMTNLVVFTTKSLWNNITDIENNTQKKGIGISYGLEFLFSKKTGLLTGWISYGYSRSFRQFQNINGGNTYPYEFDRPHDFKIFTNYKINDNLNISAVWLFQSGRPINFPVGYYNSVTTNEFDFDNGVPLFNNSNIELYTEKNSIRMKPYHRLDITINWSKQKKKSTRIWSFGIYNVYSRLNPMYYYFRYDNDTNTRKLYQYSLFPIIPSLSYSLKF